MSNSLSWLDFTGCIWWQVGDSEKELGGAEGQNPYSTMVDEANGLDKIEELQNHSNREIYEKAVNILETFFDVEDGEVENLAPAIDANQVLLSSACSSVLLCIEPGCQNLNGVVLPVHQSKSGL